MEQENADGKIEGKPQTRTRRTWVQFWKLVAICFVIHLIPVLFVLFSIARTGEAVMLWLLFLFIDFPLAWLYIPVTLFVEPLFRPDIIRCPTFWNVTFPAIFFQIVGTINWVIIVLFLRWLVRPLFSKSL